MKSITPNGQFGSGSLSDITRWTVVGYAPLGIADLALWMDECRAAVDKVIKSLKIPTKTEP